MSHSSLALADLPAAFPVTYRAGGQTWSWSHLQNCQKENTFTRDRQVGKSQAIPLKSNPQSSVAGGYEPAGLSWYLAACPILLSPTLLLEFPLLSVCGRCLVTYRVSSECSGRIEEFVRCWPTSQGQAGKLG